MIKRVISLVLSIVLIFSLMPVSVIATDDAAAADTTEVEETLSEAQDETESASDETADVTASGTCGDNLTWVLTSDGVLTISGAGAMYDYENATAPWYQYYEGITSIVIEEGVTYIGEYAFVLCQNATSVSIADTVTEIGTHAFEHCRALFNLDLGNGVQTIGIYAFRDCPALTSIVIPDSVTTVCNFAFEGCSALSDITIGSGVTALNSGTFSYCTSLTEITIPASVTTFADQVFLGCTALEKITFCGNAPAFPEYAFNDVTSTVYYPAGNETWTDEVMQDYGGTITWVPYEVEEEGKTLFAAWADFSGFLYDFTICL